MRLFNGKKSAGKKEEAQFAPRKTQNLNPACCGRCVRTLKRTCVIHILELGYTSESSHDDCLTRKRDQHAMLVALLQHNGWTVSATTPRPSQPSDYVHIILLGTTGYVFRPTDTILTKLGVPACALPKLLTSLSKHAINFHSSIIRLRRRLENLPSAFVHTRAVVLHDPP